MKKLSMSVIAAASLLITALPAQAVMVNSVSSTGVFTVANDDLIQGIAPVLTGTLLNDVEGLNTDTTGAALTNGDFGPAGLTDNPGPNPEVSIVHNNTGIEFTINLSNPLGYNITDINTYSGWRDSGRVDQDYEIFYTTTTNGIFQSLTSVSEDYSGGNPSSMAVYVSDIGLTGVTAIRFAFTATQNGYVGYREFDVIGSRVAVPEPTTLLLLGLGLAGLGFARRRLQ